MAVENAASDMSVRRAARSPAWIAHRTASKASCDEPDAFTPSDVAQSDHAAAATNDVDLASEAGGIGVKGGGSAKLVVAKVAPSMVRFQDRYKHAQVPAHLRVQPAAVPRQLETTHEL